MGEVLPPVPPVGEKRLAFAAGAYSPAAKARLFGKAGVGVAFEGREPERPTGALRWADEAQAGLLAAADVAPAPVVPGERGELIDFESVEERLLEAFETLRQLPDPAPGPKVRIMALWREVLPERVDQDGEGREARPGVSRALHGRMEEAFGWCDAWLSGEERRLLGVALAAQQGGAQVNWPAVRRKLRTERTTDALRKAYSRALSRICGKLNAGSGKHFG